MFFVKGITLAYTTMIEIGQPTTWISSPSFRAKRLLILVWLMAGFFISMAYKALVLGALIKVQYEKPINTIEDLLVFIKSQTMYFFCVWWY